MRSPAPAVLAWPADPPPASATPHRGLPQLWLVHPPGCGLANRIQVGQPTDGWVYPPDGGAAGRGGGEGGGDRDPARPRCLIRPSCWSSARAVNAVAIDSSLAPSWAGVRRLTTSSTSRPRRSKAPPGPVRRAQAHRLNARMIFGYAANAVPV